MASSAANQFWWIKEQEGDFYTYYNSDGYRTDQRLYVRYSSHSKQFFYIDEPKNSVPSPNPTYFEELPSDVPEPPSGYWDDHDSLWKTTVYPSGLEILEVGNYLPVYYSDDDWRYIRDGEPVPSIKGKERELVSGSVTPTASATPSHIAIPSPTKSTAPIRTMSTTQTQTQNTADSSGQNNQDNSDYEADNEQTGSTKRRRPGWKRKGDDDGGSDGPSDGGGSGRFSFTSSMSNRTHTSYKGKSYSEIKENKYVAKPPIFDGSNFPEFWESVIDNIRANPKYFESYKNRIEFALSYFRGNALSWKQNYLYDPDNAVGDDYLDYPYNPDTDRLELPQEKTKTEVSEADWFRFIQSLKRDFETLDSRTEARRKILNTRQGGRKASEFFQRLETLRRQARWLGSAYDEMIIERLKENLDGRLVDHIYSQEKLPVTYSDWKQAAIRWDQREQAKKSVRNTSDPFPSSSSPRPSSPFVRSPTPTLYNPYGNRPNRSPSPGNFNRAPAPRPATPFRPASPARASRTELSDDEYQKRKDNNECFGCGQKWSPGHRCAQRNQRIRAAVHNLEEEDRATLLDTLSVDFPKSPR